MDTHQLTTHLNHTPTYITRHRNQLTTKPPPDNPTHTPAGPKPPCNLNALHWADQEAATLGHITTHCHHHRTIPPPPPAPLWYAGGICQGLHSTADPEELRPLIDHLTHYAPFIIGTTGIEPILTYAHHVRACSTSMFPQERTNWISTRQAMALTGRAEKTINDWRRAGWVRHIKDEYGTLYDREGVTTVCQALTMKRTLNLPNGKRAV